MATAQAEVRFDAAAMVLQNQIKNNLRSIINTATSRMRTRKNGSQYNARRFMSRDVYQSGDDAGKWWTARTAGNLLWSVRTVKQHKQNGEPSSWVMVGNKQAYYATMFEYSKGNAKGYRGRPYWRPAIATSKSKMVQIWEKGV